MADIFDISELNEDNSNENMKLKTECENLLYSSVFDSEEISETEKELWYYEEEELMKLKMSLLNNQIDHIDAGINYGQRDINKKLDKII